MTKISDDKIKKKKKNMEKTLFCHDHLELVIIIIIVITIIYVLNVFSSSFTVFSSCREMYFDYILNLLVLSNRYRYYIGHFHTHMKK